MAQALLTVTFSAPTHKAIDDPLDAFCTAISAAFPERRHIHTVSNLHFASSDAPFIGDALIHLADAGYNDVLIQPCFIFAGPECEKVRMLSCQYAPRFTQLSLGRPLIAGEGDLFPCVQAILPTLPEGPVVFMAHGTRAFGSTDYTPLLEQAFAKLGHCNIYFANLEGPNGLDALLSRLKEDSIELRPFLFCPRLHRKRDLEQRWTSALEQNGRRVSCRTHGLCVYPELQDIYIRHAREAL